MSQRYAITHVTQFSYDAPVSESVMEVRLRPLTGDQQQCLQFAIDVEPRARTFSYQDFLGNWVHHFNVPRRHRQLVITVRAHVEVDDGPVVPGALAMDAWRQIDAWADATDHWEFRQPSQFARHSDRLLEFTRALGIDRTSDPLSVVRAVTAGIYDQFEYAPNTTRVDSPVDEAIAARRGVCQDFSHIMIAVLRGAGIPARYVSGYIAPAVSPPPADDQSTRNTALASHAWVEALLPELGWIGFDPTHNIVAGTRHVRVAVGRDYADVPPTRGVFKGHAASSLDVSVNIAPAARLDVPLDKGDVADSGADWPAAAKDDGQAQQQQQQQQQ